MSENRNSANETENKEMATMLSNVTDAYMPLIERQLEDNKINFSEYARDCVIHGIMAINNTLKVSGVSWNDKNLDKSNVQEILIKIAQLQLNASVTPRECFFQLRNVNAKKRNEKGELVDNWVKSIEMGIEGNGFDSLVARFGRDVKKVMPFWVVKENDMFEYPSFNGLESTPPKWQPKGTGKVVRVVYPIIDTGNIIHYYIGEREDVKKNLLAHINNNMMNETFGICANRYKATPEQLKQIEECKKAMKLKARDMTLEEILDSSDFDRFISPAWKEDFSREEMITRKIRNNIMRKIPMNFNNSYLAESYDQVTNESYKNVIDIINEDTASKEIELQGTQFDTETSELNQGNTNTREEPKGANKPNLEPDIENRKKPDFD